MIPEETLRGGSLYVQVNTPATVLSMGRGRMFYLDVSGAGIGGTVDLPDARTVPLGAPPIWIYATGGNVVLQDNLQNPIGTLANGEIATCYLVTAGGAAGVWHFDIRTEGAPPAAVYDTRIHYFGGDGVADDEVGQFNAQTSTWSTLTSANRDLTDAAAATDGRKVWVFGDTSPADQAKIEEYDRLADTWVTKSTAFPNGLSRPGVVYDAGFIYVFGGGVGAGNERKAWKYDPVGQTFTALADVPGSDTTFQAVSANGRLHVMGPTSHYVYDQADDSYDSRSVRPGNWRNYGLAHFFDRILACGGDDNAGTETAEAHTYTYRTDSWQAIADMPNPRTKCGAAHVGARRLLVIGGERASASKSNNWFYDGSTWTVLTALPAARTDLHRLSLPLIA